MTHCSTPARPPVAACGVASRRSASGASPRTAPYSAGAAGIPSLGFGPEEEQYVHTALDQVSLSKLRKAAAFYALFPFVYGR